MRLTIACAGVFLCLASAAAPYPARQAQADAYLDAAKAAQARGDEGAALTALTQSINRDAASGQEAAIAESYRLRGRLFDSQGKFTEALDDYLRFRAITEDLGDRPGTAAALNLLSSVYQVLGNIPLARESARAGLEIGEALDDPAIMAAALNTLGIISESAGDHRAALESYMRSLSLRRAAGNKIGVARSLVNIGNVYSAQGNYPLALEQYRESLALTQETGDRAFEAIVYITIGNAYGRATDYTVAIENLERSLNISRAIHNDMGIAYATLNIAEAHRLQGQLEESRLAFLDALGQAEKLGHMGLRAATLLSLSKVLREQGQAEASLDAAQRAIALASEAGERETVWEAQAIAGQAHRALKQDAEAAARFNEAIANIETMRANVAGGEEDAERSFETQVLPYHAMVELLIAQGRPAEALTYAERAKGRVLLDVLHSGRVPINKAMTPVELQTERTLAESLATVNRRVLHPAAGTDLDRARADLAAARREYDGFQAGLYVAHPELRAIRGEARAISLADAADLLPDSRTALLEYVVTDTSAYLFVLTRGAGSGTPALECFTIAVTKKALSDLAERFREQLAQRNAGFRASATQLYDLLLRPAQALLAGRDNLIVVPEAVLWNLPFQALQSGGNRYAIEDHAFAYAPSLTVLREMTRGRAARSTRPQTVLAVGNPTSDLAPLPDAERQVKTLSLLYGAKQSRVLVGGDADEDRVKRAAGDYRILHLATHGVFDNTSPMHSYVVLAHGKDSRDDGLLEAREIMDLNLQADLVVLSACETARGRVGAGEGVIGLTWAFFVAGSPTTIVSQWNVESSSTTALMLAFHRSRLARLRAASGGAVTAQALRSAALGLLKESAYRHPFYWAGFVVVGDGR